MSSESPFYSIADRKPPEFKILIGFSVAGGMLGVLRLLIPLRYALHLGCIDKRRTERKKSYKPICIRRYGRENHGTAKVLGEDVDQIKSVEEIKINSRIWVRRVMKGLG